MANLISQKTLVFYFTIYEVNYFISSKARYFTKKYLHLYRSALPKILVPKNEDFSFVPKAQHHLRATHATSFDRLVNIIAACGTHE